MDYIKTVSGINDKSLAFLERLYIPKDIALYINVILLFACAFVITWSLDKLFNVVITRIFLRMKQNRQGSFLMALVENKVVRKVAHLIPFSIFINIIPIILGHFPTWIRPVTIVLNIMMIILITGIFKRIFRSITDVAETKPGLKDKPLESYVQVVNIALFFIASILIFSQITGKQVWALFTAMGAMSAILLLVFKDSIMGFVASIQVTTNDMVRIGDWIEMPKYGADGDVVEITLTTVKVQNFDKTITTIPTYALISDSFKNWRGMQDAGGRRIKRSISLRMSGIKFLTDDEIRTFEKISLVKDYIQERKSEIDKYNHQIQADKSVLINGRNMTNAGIFRRYIVEYLRNNPNIKKDFSMMVRQMPPNEKGMPLEIYCFANTIKWVDYEGIMSDVFDHIIAAAPYFHLEIFEDPSSYDLSKLAVESRSGK